MCSMSRLRLQLHRSRLKLFVLEAEQEYLLYITPYKALAHALVTCPASEDHNGPHRLQCPTGFDPGSVW